MARRGVTIANKMRREDEDAALALITAQPPGSIPVTELTVKLGGAKKRAAKKKTAQRRR